ncbi:MAG TPA: gephyrin-like molybdotransferase Glp [Acidimicrobiales bacterium]|nr:gephyrin-like molybdotransferase Glp [Acidimicrobiales bacterium]
MIPLADARRAVLERCSPLPAVTVDVADAVGCVLASAAEAAGDVPPFANSSMDGYALRAADVAAAPVALSVVGRVLAGSTPTVAVGPGEAARIMTGAPVPAGADAVCMVERTHPSDVPGGEGVVIESAVAVGENVRPAGDDVRAGEHVLDAGSTVGPAQLGALVSAGCRSVVVHRRPRVGVLSTGDELVPAGAARTGAAVYDSNGPMLRALVAEAGATAVDLGTVPDDAAAIAGRVTGALGAVDVLVLSGGVSVGDVDLVKGVLQSLDPSGFRWMQVAVRPAKPFCFARLSGADGPVPAFGLPGNPVSSAVSFELFVRPALLALSGHRATERPRLWARAGDVLRRQPDGRLHLMRVRLERTGGAGPTDGDGWGAGPTAGDGWVARPCPGQGSHQIRSLALADGLAFLPDGDSLPAGSAVEVMVTNPAVLAGGR